MRSWQSSSRVGKVAGFFGRLNDRDSTEPGVPEPGRIGLGRMTLKTKGALGDDG
jgi:hypothetical protein